MSKDKTLNDMILRVSFREVYVEIHINESSIYYNICDAFKLNSFNFDIEETNCSFQHKFFIYMHLIDDIERYQFNTTNLNNRLILHLSSKNRPDEVLVEGMYYDMGSDRYIFNPLLNTYIIFHSDSRTLHIFGDRNKIVKQVFNLVREQLIHVSLEEVGCSYLKGAIFSYNDSGELCALIGGEKSGKTTLLLHLLNANSSYKYLANSASYIKYSESMDSIEVYSYRPHMRIRTGTAKNYDFFNKQSIIPLELLNEQNKMLEDEDFIKIKTFDEFNKYFKNDILLKGMLKKVVFVNFKSETGLEYEFEKLDNESGIERIKQYLRLGHDPLHPDYLGLRTKEVIEIERMYMELLVVMGKKVDFYFVNLSNEGLDKFNYDFKKIISS